jgi:hypothetical protein
LEVAVGNTVNIRLDKYEYIVVEKDVIPDGARLVEAYETPKEIIICGYPPVETDDTPDDKRHNCDEMGCTSLSHVLYRISK